MQHFQKKARGKEEKMKNWHTKKKRDIYLEQVKLNQVSLIFENVTKKGRKSKNLNQNLTYKKKKKVEKKLSKKRIKISKKNTKKLT